MHFNLVDAVLESSPEHIVTLKQVSNAEEYLGDHFAGFPVLPGVMMLEAMVQAGRRLATLRAPQDPAATRLVLGTVRALKYGRFVRPGETLRITVTLAKDPGDGTLEFKGEGTVPPIGAAPSEGDPVAVSGRFTLRPIKTVA